MLGMNEFLKMDIFFFVTTTVVVALGALIAYVLWRVARVLKHIEHISEQVALETETIRGDLAEVRAEIREGKGKLKSLLNFFGTIRKRHTKKDS